MTPNIIENGVLIFQPLVGRHNESLYLGSTLQYRWYDGIFECKIMCGHEFVNLYLCNDPLGLGCNPVRDISKCKDIMAWRPLASCMKGLSPSKRNSSTAGIFRTRSRTMRISYVRMDSCRICKIIGLKPKSVDAWSHLALKSWPGHLQVHSLYYSLSGHDNLVRGLKPRRSTYQYTIITDRRLLRLDQRENTNAGNRSADLKWHGHLPYFWSLVPLIKQVSLKFSIMRCCNVWICHCAQERHDCS